LKLHLNIEKTKIIIYLTHSILTYLLQHHQNEKPENIIINLPIER